MAANLKLQDERAARPLNNDKSYDLSIMHLPNLPKSLVYGVIAFTSVACYLNSLDYDLVHDDIFAIKENMDIRSEAPLANIFSNDFWGKPMWSNTSHKSYRPLCVLTFRMNFAIHGLKPFGYHAVNVVLHGLVCLLYTYMCNVVAFKSSALAFIAGILFATHPVHTEAVTGVVGRADVMACLLFLLAFLAFVRSEQSKGCSQIMCTITCVVLGAMAMLVKEHGITVFGVCFVYDCMVVNKNLTWRAIRERAVSVGKEATTLKHVLIRIIVLSVAVFCLMAFRVWMLGGNLPYFTVQDNPASFSDSLSTRIMTYFYLIAFNSWLLLSPSVLSYDWQMGSIPLVESLIDSRNLATLVFVMVAALLFYSAVLSNKTPSRDQDVLVLSLAMLGIPFLPASNLFFRVGFVVAERILYIPSMGFCMLVVCGFNKLASVLVANGKVAMKDRCTEVRMNLLHKVLLSGVFVLIGLFCWKTVVRNRVWSNREALFRSGIETLPHNAKAHYNFANFLKDAGRAKEAIYHYETALRLAPNHVSAHNNLGTLLENDQEAMQHFSEAIKNDPYHANSYFNLGTRLTSLKRLSEAETVLKEAIRLNPRYLDAVLNVAGVLSDQEKFDEAEEFYKKALTLEPRNGDAHNNYAVFLGKIGRTKRALENYNKALQLNPNHTVTLVNMARQLRADGKIQDAEIAYKRALSIRRDPSTLQLLGVLYYHNQQLKEAELAWKESLELEPTNTETRSNYAILLGQTNRLHQAVGVMKGLVLDDPQNPGNYKTLAGMYAQNRQWNEALQVIASALRRHVNNAELYYFQGNFYKDLNKMQEAKKSYTKAVQLDPQLFSAHLNLGVIFHLEGNRAEARLHYEIAAKLDPGNTILKENLAKLQRLERKNKQ
ncbi:transmembrane and TPR repeat-containing protein 1-like isoform X1 [Stylophora pistillata]|uniref:transmembrane and TPR repeat-containing protein 1-like isoform X1 n=1 Tax=Stylophora pistillata TaxID=50429 RepID=UPI000C049E97|nr:transmembrane and TPR repeat-containing protein 1-like isoform X1 [Stylophora pistillata]